MTEAFLLLSQERLEQIDALWHALTESGPDPASEEDLARHLYTLKGDSALMGQSEIARLCGELELLLAAARDQSFGREESAALCFSTALSKMRSAFSRVLR